MLKLLCLAVLLVGCSAEKPIKPSVPIPPGYQVDGQCIADDFNVKTQQPSILRCTHKNGDVTIWGNPKQILKGKSQ